MGLATLPFQLSSAEVDASDQPLLDVISCVHDYFQQTIVHNIDKHSQPLINALVFLSTYFVCQAENSSRCTGATSEIASKVKTLQLR